MRTRSLDEAVAAALGEPVERSVRLSGGDTASAFRIELASGRRVFAKTHASPPPGFFTREAADLAWLAGPGVVSVPEVLAASDGGDGEPPHLVLSWVDEGRAVAGTEEAFGRSLAQLHAAEPDGFGRADRRTTGSRGLPNEPCPTWAEFYATQRLAPLARIARDEQALAPAVVDALERLDADRLVAVGGPLEPPARLHGDLWAGNRLVDRAGESWLIDPAAHGGHREFDLAMMRLFGGFGAGCFAAYHEVWPLAEGWRDRIALHQVAPLVVHAIKFGGSYRSAAADAISAYA
ncbi:MAG TPA: fructosamine kinase family protein [Acidimicrobiales bacterium]|nr:fructosamine kinase family protein [Acidimicrobiales bacterium]